MKTDWEKLKSAALSIRKDIINIAYNLGSKGCHISSNLSPVEILTALYLEIMKIDKDDYENRDRFVIGKGHAGLALYTVLEKKGLISRELLESFDTNGGLLPGQPQFNEELGLEFASGSLGHALSLAAGVALNAKRKEKKYKTFVLLGDGECNEGSIWEAALSISHLKLNNMSVIIDCNGLQSDGETKKILDMGNFALKWQSFGFYTIECDGHNFEQLIEALTKADEKPIAVLAKTIKGKGITFMENNAAWHHNRITDEQYSQAISELTER